MEELARRGRGIHATHMELLRAHFEAAREPISWRTLGKRVGLDWNVVNLQYGHFAGRFAREMGINEKPEGFWLHVVAEWAGTDSLGEQQFRMRPQLVSALRQLEWFAPGSSKGTRSAAEASRRKA